MLASKRNLAKRTLGAFTDHPKSVGETYLQHFRVAGYSGLRLALAGIACMIHSIIPCLFVSTASNTMQKIHAEIAARKKQESH